MNLVIGIKIRGDLPEDQSIKTLTHESNHALLHLNPRKQKQMRKQIHRKFHSLHYHMTPARSRVDRQESPISNPQFLHNSRLNPNS